MALFQDSFTRADATTLGPDYTPYVGAGTAAASISGNRVRFDIAGTASILLTGAGAPTSPDQFASLKILNADVASQGVMLRATPLTPTAGGSPKECTGYIVRVTPTNLVIRSNVGNGAPAVDVASVTIALAAGDKVGAKIEGATITAYLNGVQVAQGTSTTWATGGVAMINAVKANVFADDFEAGNVASDLPATGYGTAGPPPPAPGQTVGLAAGTPTAASVPLSWTATATASSYLVEYRVTGATAWTAGPTPTGASTTVTGLAAATGYDFRVTARNAGGPSTTPSAVVAATTAAAATTAPGQTVGLTVGTVTATTAPLSWTAAATASSYLVEYRTTGATTWTSGPTPSTTTATLAGLTAATEYDVRVSAVNAAGAGVPSSTVTATTAAAPVVVPPPVSQSPTGNAWRGLVINRAGEMILSGELLHRLQHDAYAPGGVLAPPPWLTVAGDASQKEGEGGYLALKATSAAPASLTVTPAVFTTAVVAVKIELDHFRFGAKDPGGTVAGEARFALTAGDATKGATGGQATGDAFASLANNGAKTDALMSHMGNDAGRRRRVGLLVNFATKEAWLLDGDQITGYRDCTAGWGAGAAPVSVTVSTTGGTPVEIRFSRLTITTYL